MLQGTVEPAFWKVARELQSAMPRSGPGGAAVCVYHRGRKVVDLWGGTRDEAGNPWQEDTVALSYSTTKGVASTLLHLLVDRGLLNYDDPVSRYWPEFSAAGKAEVTVRQLMCHEAGLYGIRDMVDHAEQMMNWDYMVDALARSAPAHAPGSAHGYHGFTYGWLVGELAQRVAGKPLGELLQSEIAGPLELDGLFIGLPEAAMDRRAQLMTQPASGDADPLKRIRSLGRVADRVLRAARIPIDLRQARAALLPRGMEEVDWNGEDFVASCIPAANGMFTARSLARMYAALAGGGELDGVRLLSREGVDRATQVQNRGFGRVVPLPMHWRLGYHRVFAMAPRLDRAFGHFGFGGSGAWADPGRDLAVALTLNSGAGSPFGDSRMFKVGTAAIRAADATLASAR